MSFSWMLLFSFLFFSVASPDNDIPCINNKLSISRIQTTPREDANFKYQAKLKEKFSCHPEIRRIARFRHVPKSIYYTSKQRRIQIMARKRKYVEIFFIFKNILLRLMINLLFILQRTQPEKSLEKGKHANYFRETTTSCSRGSIKITNICFCSQEQEQQTYCLSHYQEITLVCVKRKILYLSVPESLSSLLFCLFPSPSS